ncbi:nuclear transport factor 2 family protein [Homoserinibacter sp. GY 40078]|uniref:nuclear transport factor 2 family protein n=1 Tax=Homoserinibacter sp. GY 40078 TaxID=2603275 RepID=UPI0011CA1C8A|nr:nuclear transport factor 2 family protein [Homoserinibacter sp. GY 40078]TXK19803.1 hypothetical protein FVQ89_08070 [Homoserinibacter sp. GY 40078]
MTQRDEVARWMAGYRTAWESNEPDEIRALFTPDAEYRYEPFGEPVVGVEAIVASWLESADKPGETEFSWELAGIDGDTAFIDGRTDYPEDRRYANLWVIVFAPDGRARSFTEWYMRIPATE